MQRFTRKNGRIPVESEVDREVERRELATTGSLLAPYCDCESRRGTNWSFFPCISHDISSYLLQCTTCRYLIPHAFKTSTSGAVRSVLNSQFTNHKSQFTTHNSRLYIGGHVFRNETAYTLMTMFVQRIQVHVASRQATLDAGSLRQDTRYLTCTTTYP